MHSRSVLSVNSQYLVKSIDPPPLLSLSPSLFLSPLFPLLFLFFLNAVPVYPLFILIVCRATGVASETLSLVIF